VHLAPSADALDLLVEDRIFLGERIARGVLFVIRHVAVPRLTMADRRLQDAAMDGRVNGRSFAVALCTAPSTMMWERFSALNTPSQPQKTASGLDPAGISPGGLADGRG
jgi:hypothetical protein